MSKSDAPLKFSLKAKQIPVTGMVTGTCILLALYGFFAEFSGRQH